MPKGHIELVIPKAGDGERNFRIVKALRYFEVVDSVIVSHADPDEGTGAAHL